MAKTKIDGWRCERCQHSWVPRLVGKPTICPNCKSPYWDRPRGEPQAEECGSVSPDGYECRREIHHDDDHLVLKGD